MSASKYPIDPEAGEFGGLAIKMGGRDVTDDNSGDPTADRRFGQFYTKKTADDRIELFYEDDEGNVTQITNAGALNLVEFTAGVVTVASDASLPNERVLTGTLNQITVTDGGAGGAVTLSLPSAVILPGTISVTGHTTPATDATYDLGSATFQWRDVRFSRDVYAARVVVGDGSASAPSFAKSSATNCGLYFTGNNVRQTILGTDTHSWQSNGYFILTDAASRITFGASLDAVIERDAAAVLALKNGANAQEFRVYGTTTGPKYASLRHDGTDAYFRAQSGVLYLQSGSTFVLLNTSGHWSPDTSNAQDCGRSGKEWRSIYWGTQALAPDGTASAPAYAFASQPTRGFAVGSGLVHWTYGNSLQGAFHSSGILLASTLALQWTAGTAAGASADVILVRDAANQLALRNGTNAQTFSVYGTFTDASNYERLNIDHVGGYARVWTQGAGTGTPRNLRFGVASTMFFELTGGGHLVAVTDNVSDIGASGATRPRSIYWGTQLLGPSGAASAPDYSFAGDPDTGIRYTSAQGPFLTAAGSDGFAWWSNYLTAQSAAYIGWSATSNPHTGSHDVRLYRDAANTLAQRNSTTAQTFRLYNTWTDASNGEWLESTWSSNVAILRTAANGTGTVRFLDIRYGNTTSTAIRVGVSATGGVDLAFQSSSSALSYRVGIGLASSITATSGTHTDLTVQGTYGPSSSSTMDARTVSLSPTINYASGGAGRVQLIRLAPVNTALPTGTNGALVLSTTASDSTGLGGIHLYNTADETTNYERGFWRWQSNVLRFGAEKGGSGTGRTLLLLGGSTTVSLGIGSSSAGEWNITTSGHLVAGTDNTFDIGASGATRPRSIYWGTQAIGPAGSTTNPSVAVGDTNTGLYNPGSVLGVVRLGTEVFRWDASGAIIHGSLSLRWGSSGISTPDLFLQRDAANTLAQRNSTTAQAFRIYNTFTDASNYERATISWSTTANVLVVGQQVAGTGTARSTRFEMGTNLLFASGGSDRWQFNASFHLLAVADNTYDIGASGATRPRTVYVGTSFVAPAGSAGAPSYTFTGTTSGLYLVGGSTWALVYNSTAYVGVLDAALQLRTNAALSWSSGAINAVSDTTMTRGEAGCVRHINTRTITGGVTDGYTAAIRLSPTYDAATAQTVDRHNYIDLEDVLLTGAGPAAVTDACVFRLNAALGTHKATTNTDKTGNTKDGTLKVNVNGTIKHIQLYAN